MSLGLSPKSPLERSLLAREGSLGRAEGELPGASCFCSPSEGVLDGITLLKGGPGPGPGQSQDSVPIAGAYCIPQAPLLPRTCRPQLPWDFLRRGIWEVKFLILGLQSDPPSGSGQG